MEHVVIFITAASADEAARIGRILVQERLAACSNLIPAVASTYWWQGRIEEASEALLVVKSRRDLVEQVAARVRQLHSYTVPEVVALPILGGNPAYLDWIDDSVGAHPAP